jgi:hypothetical protein
LSVTHRLNAHFVDIDAALHLAVEYEGVDVTIAASVPEEGAFARVMCTGSTAVPARGNSAIDPRLAPGDPRILGMSWQFLVPATMDSSAAAALDVAFEHVEEILERVGAALRWRFGLAGGDSVLAQARAEVICDDGQVVELQPLSPAMMGDNRAAVGEPGWSEFANIVASETWEPIGHQLLREAWNLHNTNPRSSLVIGITAAEVGLKQLIAKLVPAARSLVEDLPSPPLAKMMKHTLPDLPVRADVPRDRRCPRDLRRLLDQAVQERNLVVHQGAQPTRSLRETLGAVREFLYLLDLYAGHPWAAEQLSEATLAALEVSST